MSLKRFKQGRSAYSGTNLTGKIETYVDFPIEGLDLAPYCCDTATCAQKEKTSSSSSSKQQTGPESSSSTTTTDGDDENSSNTVGDDPSSSSSSSSSSSLLREDPENPDRTLYDLFAVCNHFGRMGFGHYTAFARDWMDMYTQPPAPHTATSSSSSSSSGGGGGGGVGGWYKYDDEDVTPVRNPEGEIKTPAAYILFYRRRPANPRAS